MPKDVDWIKVGADKPSSLPFIAQFNLKDVKEYDEENLLPSEGNLYFFADPYGGGWKDLARVVFFDGNPSLLERKPFPDDIPISNPYEDNECYEACVVEFVPEVNLPSYDGDWNDLKKWEYEYNEIWDNYDDLIDSASYADPSPPPIVNRLLGYNFGVPHDMPLDCELIMEHGYPFGASKELRERSERNKGDWQLLFQMGSDLNAGMMWSDMGVICFYARRNDLANRIFDDVCLLKHSG